VTRRLLPIFYAWFALLLVVHPAMAQGEGTWEKQFQAQIHEWMNAIAGRDPQFKTWQNAQTEVQTLGANQHQWLVSIKQSGQQVGYMVIGEAPEPKPNARFVLLEYGVGDYILFDDAFAPREVAAEPVYDGFASHWLIANTTTKDQMVNAKTGEKYPTAFHANEPVMGKLAPNTVIHAGERLTQARILKPTTEDPFDQVSWMDPSSSNQRITWGQLWAQQANQTRITFTAPLFHEQVLAPYVVGSLHLWNDQNPYIGVWDEGLRFVPFSYADQIGQFHVNETSSPAE
jgi:hypothetical protein